MSADQSVLRPTIFGSLLDIARTNRSHGAHDIAVFESGSVFRRGEGPLVRPHSAARPVILEAEATEE